MADNKTKLEITWIGKGHRFRLEPPILAEVPVHGHLARTSVTESAR